jgi:hypothetical protein
MGYTLSKGAVEKLAKVARKTLSSEGPSNTPAGSSTPTPAFWAEITGEADGFYAWKLVYAVGSGFVDRSPAVTGAGAFEANGVTGIASGTKVRLRFIGYQSDAARYVFTIGAATLDFACEEDGGDDGDDTTAPTFTYSIFAMDDAGEAVGDAIATEVPVVMQRPLGAVDPALHCRVRPTSTGGYIIVWCDEVPETCEEDEI